MSRRQPAGAAMMGRNISEISFLPIPSIMGTTARAFEIR